MCLFSEGVVHALYRGGVRSCLSLVVSSRGLGSEGIRGDGDVGCGDRCWAWRRAPREGLALALGLWKSGRRDREGPLEI